MRRIVRARICKPFKEPRNRFPAWRNRFLGSLRALEIFRHFSCGTLLKFFASDPVLYVRIELECEFCQLAGSAINISGHCAASLLCYLGAIHYSICVPCLALTNDHPPPPNSVQSCYALNKKFLVVF